MLGVIDRDADFSHACGDEFQFSIIGADISCGIDVWEVSFHMGVDADLIVGDFQSPVEDRSKGGFEADIDGEPFAGDESAFPGFSMDCFDGLNFLVSDDFLHGFPGADADGGVTEEFDVFFVGAESVVSVDKGDSSGDVFEVESPIHGAISSSHNHNVFIFKVLDILHAIGEPFSQELFFAWYSEFGGFKGAHTPADDDGFRGIGRFSGGKEPTEFFLGEGMALFIEAIFGVETACLYDHLPCEFGGFDLGEPGHIIDGLVRIKGDELTSWLGEGVYDPGAHTP